ncbi:MAG: Rieske (2Fe-2S) protein [Chlorobi bacterium]|nr:Rieske (2Fe-2S) protein [Chlorobiota bacterium]
MTRRQLLQWVLHSSWLAFVGIAAGRLFQRNDLVRLQSRKVRVCTLDQLKTSSSGGAQANVGGRQIFVRVEGEDIRALDLRCTHGNCTVRLVHNPEERFICPCHGGMFSIDGSVITGPPRKPLAEIPVRLEGNDVFVLDLS